VVCENEGGGMEASFYSLQGRFPLFLYLESLATALRKHRGYSMSKCTWMGVHLGSANQRVQPTLGGASPALPSSS
jgi:hypothetical protein